MKRLLFAASILGVALLAAQSEIMTFSPAVSPTPGGYTVVAGEIPNVDSSHLSRKTVIRLDTKTGRASYADTVNLGDETVLMWEEIHDRDSFIEYINNKAARKAQDERIKAAQAAQAEQLAKPSGM